MPHPFGIVRGAFKRHPLLGENAILLVRQLLMGGVLFVSAIILAYVLPPSDYGIYKYVLGLGMLIGAATLTGMNAAVTRAVAKGQTDVTHGTLWPQVKWGTIATLVGVGIAMYHGVHGDMGVALVILLLALCVPLTNALNTYQATLNGKREFKRGAVYMVGASIVTTVVLVVLLWITTEPLVLAVATTLATLATTAWAYLRTINTRVRDPQSGATVRYGLHMSLANAPLSIIQQLDTVLVFHLLGPVALAAYSIAMSMPDQLRGIVKNLYVTMLPRFAGVQGDIQHRYLWQQLGIAVATIVCGAGLYVILAPYLLPLFFPKYVPTIGLSQLYAITLIPYATTMVLLGAIQAQGKIRSQYVYSVLAAISDGIGMVAGLIMAGLPGLFIGKGCSQLLQSIVLYHKFRSQDRVMAE